MFSLHGSPCGTVFGLLSELVLAFVLSVAMVVAAAAAVFWLPGWVATSFGLLAALVVWQLQRNVHRLHARAEWLAWSARRAHEGHP